MLGARRAGSRLFASAARTSWYCRTPSRGGGSARRACSIRRTSSSAPGSISSGSAIEILPALCREQALELFARVHEARTHGTWLDAEQRCSFFGAEPFDAAQDEGCPPLVRQLGQAAVQAQQRASLRQLGVG